jgi:hypothetical protein
LAFLCAGCPLRNNARYCDANSPCRDPAFPVCNQATKECEAGVATVDLSLPAEDLSVARDLSGELDFSRLPDLANADLRNEDLRTPDLRMPDLQPACVSSASCADPALPICDSVTETCRPCSAGDDSACALHGAGLRCKTSGVNMGRCELCDGTDNSQCPPTTPVCNSDGTCRKCALHSECASGICDLRGTGTDGQCAVSDDIALVHARDNPTSGTCAPPLPSPVGGSMPSPYCQVLDALNDMGGRHFVQVAPSSLTGHATYDPVDITTSVTAYLVGPGTSASVFSLDGYSHTVREVAASAQAIDLTFDGFNFSGDTAGSNIYCDSTGGTSKITVRNSLISSGSNGLRAVACTATVSETIIQGGTGTSDGLLFDNGSSYSAQNVMISGWLHAGVETNSSSKGGTFSFNTLSFNGNGGNTGGAICGITTRMDDSIISGNSQNSGTQFSSASLCVLNNVVTGTDTLTAGANPSPPAFVSTTPPYDLHLDVGDAPSGPNTLANLACCIDKVPAATPSPSPLPAIDIDRDKRPIGAAWDIGADEAL